jgi:GntR family transcriptional regulator
VIVNAQALPLYHQVAGVLRQRIEDGIYPVGGKLLSEDELAAEFEVSRATIRQAVGELVMEGLVVRRQGRGTYVEARDKHILQQRFRGSLGDLLALRPSGRHRDEGGAGHGAEEVSSGRRRATWTWRTTWPSRSTSRRHCS